MQRTTAGRRTRAAAIIAAVLAAAVGAPAAQENNDGIVEWPYVGADQASSKYSPLTDINRSNVDQLEVAWTWEPNELPSQEFGVRPGRFEVMPLMIDNVVYVSTMFARVVAIDAETGDELWTFDPESWRLGPEGSPPGGFKHRGVAVWGEGDAMRIFINSRDKLYAVDAADGTLIPTFGDDGRVVLTENFPNPVTPDMFDQTSPPVVFEDLVIVGGRVPDRIQRRVRHARLGAGVRRRDRRAPLGLLHGAAVERRVRRRYLGERIVALHRARQRLGPDVARRSAWPALWSRPARRAATTGAASGSGPTCSPSRSSASTHGPASGSGTSRRCITGCGTTTSRRPPT